MCTRIVQPVSGQLGVWLPPVDTPLTAVIVAVGAVSLQLCTSSLPCVLVLVDDSVVLGLPPMNRSTFQLATLPPVVCLARSGVQLVANLPETLSIVAEGVLP